MHPLRKIVVAPDSFKESLSASEVAAIIAAALREQLPGVAVLEMPVADGGEGTLDVLVRATAGRRHMATVSGPLGAPVTASWGLLGDGRSAIIEMATASGLMLVPPTDRNPLLASTEGTGELILAALDTGARHFILAIGGSATNDGGSGMLRALGMRFLDDTGRDLPAGGAALARLARIDPAGLDPRLAHCRFDVACDVDNPLTGPQGASQVFGPQKGASPAMVATLDAALAHYGAIIKTTLGRDVAQMPGAGAAGGMGAAALAFLGGRLRPGIDIVLDALEFDARIADADLLITGEGRLDGQSLRGKSPIGVARRGKRAGLPVIALAGSVADDVDAVHPHGIDAVFACVPRAMPLADVLAEARTNLARTARNVAALLALGRQ
ncbi:glycerate kinase [Chitinilyticum aquatile]|uniref:glycerate kinase n=1 Tax=Chitinilyticum aquatile TaxID=362520 RepID=UPI000410250E|nr:glycerate kinase [Chitinilyticum aquatile]